MVINVRKIEERTVKATNPRRRRHLFLPLKNLHPMNHFLHRPFRLIG